MTRRSLVKLAGFTAAGLVARSADAQAGSSPVSLFDGKTLDGWLQYENSATSLSAAGISDTAAFATWLSDGSDAMSVFLRTRLSGPLKRDLADFSPSAPNSKAVIAALLKELNQIIAGPSLYDKDRLAGIVLRRETAEMVLKAKEGLELARLNKLLLEDSYPEELVQSAATGWAVKDGAMASLGTGRGVIYTENDYERFRLTFTMRHVSGNPDHQACLLVFCTRPQAGELPLDALGGIQFQPPNGGHWDYRPGKNTDGGPEFTVVNKPQFDPHAWSRVELLADAASGTARMAVAQPPGTRAVEVLSFRGASAGKAGPIAWQMHNAGLFDEYRDIVIERDPNAHDLITTK